MAKPIEDFNSRPNLSEIVQKTADGYHRHSWMGRCNSIASSFWALDAESDRNANDDVCPAEFDRLTMLGDQCICPRSLSFPNYQCVLVDYFVAPAGENAACQITIEGTKPQWFQRNHLFEAYSKDHLGHKLCKKITQILF